MERYAIVAGVIAFAASLTGHDAEAGVAVEKGYVGAEIYHYPQDGAAVQEHGNAAIVSQVELRARISDRWAAKLTPFARYDALDSHRNTFDLREAEIEYSNGAWRASAGLRSISWSVTESVGVLPHQVVDVVNQRDLAGDPSGRERMGAAMVTASYRFESTVIEASVLPWFRERKFADRRAREHPYRAAIDLADPMVEYSSDAGAGYVGGALRVARSFDAADVAFIQYRGYLPQPLIAPHAPTGQAAALYYLIDMSALTVQATSGQWLIKSETAYFGTRQNGPRFPGVPSDYWGSVSGVEYTFVNLFAGTDLGVFVEGMYDSRGAAPNGTPFHKNAFFGIRWVANDQADSQLLCGVMSSLDERAQVAQLEYQRRIGTSLQFELILRTFDAAETSPLSAFNDDSVGFFRLRGFF